MKLGSITTPEDQSALDVRLIAMAGTAKPGVIADLLAHGADPRAHTANGWTALLAALNARANITNAELDKRVRTATLLLDAGADPHAVDARGRTVFWHACNLARGKAKELVARLLATKPDLLAVDHESFSILHMAASWNHRDVLDAAIAAGADVNAIFAGGASTALRLAVARGHVAIVERLLAAGADPDASGSTNPDDAPIAKAVWSHGRKLAELIPIIQTLRAHGADATYIESRLRSNENQTVRGKRLDAVLAALEGPSR